MLKVHNKRNKRTPAYAIYVGRPSKWGNPFRMRVETESQREEAVNYFRGYAEDRLKQEVLL